LETHALVAALQLQLLWVCCDEQPDAAPRALGVKHFTLRIINARLLYSGLLFSASTNCLFNGLNAG